MSCKEMREAQGLPPDPNCPEVVKKIKPGESTEAIRKKQKELVPA